MSHYLKWLSTATFWRLLLLVSLLTAIILDWPLPLRLDASLYSRFCQLRTAPAQLPLAVVAIDNASLAQVGEWPWPRTILAEAVRAGADAGAQGIGLQLLLPAHEWNPGLAGIKALQDELPRNSANASLQSALSEMAQKIDGDRSLQRAIKKAGDVVLPWRPSASGADPDRHILGSGLNDRSESEGWQRRLATLHNPWSMARNHRITKVQQSYDELLASADAQGGVWGADADGEFDLMRPMQGKLLPSFAVQLARNHAAAKAEGLKAKPGRLNISGKEIAVGDAYRVLVNPQQVSSIPVYSCIDLVNGQLAADALKGKAVLIGRTDTGASDNLLVTASVVADLLSGTTVYRPHWAFLLETAVVLYLGIFLILIVPRLSPRFGWFLLYFFLVSWVAVVGALLVSQGLWFHLAPAMVLVVAGSLCGLISVGARRGSADYENIKLLGLSLQGQGMLDMAYEKFMQCPVRDPSVRELLYNLALDFERKRLFHKAEGVYQHILKAGSYKDVKNRLESLQQTDQTQVLGSGRSGGLALGGGTRPTLGRYEVLRELGQGAMGTVYLGRDPKINREVAIKTLNLQQIEPQQLTEIKTRFFREAEAAGRLNHSNIVTIYDAGEEHDLAYMAMEYLPGKTLAEHCVRNKLLPPKEAMRIAADIAAALAYAHEHDVVHRDIKPANIMLLPDGKVKVTDFGIARVVSASHTQTGVILGTPSYMSPEQVSGKKVDGRSDLFSLGVVCYELLCGEKPFTGDNLGALMYSISNADYPPLQKKVPKKLPAICYDVIGKLLAKGVTRRYKTAGEAEEALRACSAKL